MANQTEETKDKNSENSYLAEGVVEQAQGPNFFETLFANNN